MPSRPLVAWVLLVAATLVTGGCTPSVDQQRRPIGAGCATSGQCGRGRYFCAVDAPGGDCEATCRADSDCPTGAVCVGAGLVTSGACHVTCMASADCRSGFVCALTADASHAYCAVPPPSDGGDDDDGGGGSSDGG